AAWWGPPLLYRSGGYWWDGTTWFRPSQIWDVAQERYVNRPVPAAVTVHAADLLQDGRDADPGRASVLEVPDVDTGKPPRGRWHARARTAARGWAAPSKRSAGSVGQVVSARRPAATTGPRVTWWSNRSAASFWSLLWEAPGRRKRWALPCRTETAAPEFGEGC